MHLRIMAILSQREPLVLFQDEARFGRITEPHTCWAPAPLRPLCPQQAIREYVYVHGAFDPKRGVADTFILPDMAADTMSVFLREVGKRHTEEEILIVMDGAPCHRSGTLTIPDNTHLCILPPYSPESNPSENMWEHLRENWFGNTVFKNMSALKHHLVIALQSLDEHPETVRSITGWKWITDE